MKSIFRLYNDDNRHQHHQQHNALVLSFFSFLPVTQRDQWVTLTRNLHHHRYRLLQGEVSFYQFADWVDLLNSLVTLENLSLEQHMQPKPTPTLTNQLRSAILHDLLKIIHRTLSTPSNKAGLYNDDHSTLHYVDDSADSLSSFSISSTQSPNNDPHDRHQREQVQLFIQFLRVCCLMIRRRNKEEQDEQRISVEILNLLLSMPHSRILSVVTRGLCDLCGFGSHFSHQDDERGFSFKRVCSEIEIALISFVPMDMKILATFSSSSSMSSSLSSSLASSSSSSSPSSSSSSSFVYVLHILQAAHAMLRKRKREDEQARLQRIDHATQTEQSKIKSVLERLVIHRDDHDGTENNPISGDVLDIKTLVPTPSEQKFLDELEPYFNLLSESKKAWKWESHRMDLLMQQRKQLHPISASFLNTHVQHNDDTPIISSSSSLSSSSSTPITLHTTPFIYSLPM